MMRHVVYAHFIEGDDKPFYYGSGLANRPSNFDRGKDWHRYVESRSVGSGKVRAEILKHYECEGWARYDECMLATKYNAPANYIGAARCAIDLLTGNPKNKPGQLCNCGSDNCRQRVWRSMSPEQQDQEMLEYLQLVDRNRQSRGLSRTPIAAKMAEYRKRRSQAHHWFSCRN
jgi:hypothetical protein